MIIVSSLSPNHLNSEQQIHAIESWKPYGELFSLNIPSEIEQMKLVYQDHIHFIKTEKTIKHLVGKNLVSINAMLDFGVKCDRDILLINSDILIDKLPELKQDGITIISRYDYTDHYGDAKMFTFGFDAFFIPKKFLNIFPTSIYAMGCAFWDYALPLRFLLNNTPVYWPQGRFIFHKIHPTQYDYDQWIYISDYFRWEFKAEKGLNAGQIATKFVNEIKIKSIK